MYGQVPEKFVPEILQGVVQFMDTLEIQGMTYCQLQVRRWKLES
jgi:hypothetical protein